MLITCKSTFQLDVVTITPSLHSMMDVFIHLDQMTLANWVITDQERGLVTFILVNHMFHILLILKLSLEPVDTLAVQVIRQVALGSHHTCALNEWGQVFSWGSNSSGQLGLGSMDLMVPMPKMIKSLATKQVIQIACGQNHTLALTNGMYIKEHSYTF